MKKNTAPQLINPICAIRRCDAPARYNFVVQGHPNGDMAASYCHEHSQHVGHWDESPTPYSITITGPFGGAK